MNKGDLVRCRYDFRFEAVNNEDLLTISIIRIKDDAAEKDYIIVPLYLHGLGFFPPGTDFCLPGSYLPISHPDYFRETGTGTFLYNGQDHKISFDPDFMYTGQYWLIPVHGGGPKTRFAQHRSEQLRKQRIADAVGSVLDGIMIEGIILDFLVREKSTNALIQVINGKIVTSDHQVGDSVVFAYLQDPVTRVEFQFPVKYLITKP